MPIKFSGPSIAPVNWGKLHWAPEKEDYKQLGSAIGRFFYRLGFRSYQEPKWVPQLYNRFTSLCIPESGYAYAVLSPVWNIGGFDDLRSSLDALGLQSLVVPWKGRKRDTLIAEIRKEQVPTVFDEGSWPISQHYFFVTKDRTPDMLQQLKESFEYRGVNSDIEFHGVNYELLAKVKSVVCNYYEHGIEAASISMNTDDFRNLASLVSRELNVAMEVDKSLMEHRSHRQDQAN